MYVLTFIKFIITYYNELILIYSSRWSPTNSWTGSESIRSIKRCYPSSIHPWWMGFLISGYDSRQNRYFLHWQFTVSLWRYNILWQGDDSVEATVSGFLQYALYLASMVLSWILYNKLYVKIPSSLRFSSCRSHDPNIFVVIIRLRAFTLPWQAKWLVK